MGNSQKASHEDNAQQIAKKKDEIQFVQDDFIRQVEGDINKQYHILSPSLKSNQFYELRKIIHIKTRLVRAVFIVHKYKIRSKERQFLEQQISKLKRIDHPYLVKIYQLYKDSHKFYIVCQLCHGDSLATLLQNQGSLTERHSAMIMRQIFSALSYCHKRGVIHTDLKMQNIIFNSRYQEVAKVIDFSISRIFRIQQIIQQSKNKIFLASPQSLVNQCNQKSDIWSCGIILYTLISGKPPFLGQCKKKMAQKLTFYQPDFSERKFQFVSKQVKSLIKQMLKHEPSQRPSAKDCLEHAWMKAYYQAPRVSPGMLKRCLMECYNYNPSSKLQQASWTFFVNVLVSFQQKQDILKVFEHLDRGAAGQISGQDLYQGFKKLYDEQTAQFITKFIGNKQKTQSIRFSQFVTVCTNRDFLISETNVSKIFGMIDDDSSGQITVGQLKEMLGSSKQVTQQVWLELMKEADSNSDGMISLFEFQEMMRALTNRKNEHFIRVNTVRNSVKRGQLPESFLHQLQKNRNSNASST